MSRTRNKDLEEFGRRESNYIPRKTTFEDWEAIVSVKSSLELNHKVFGRPSSDQINLLYKEFLLKLKELRDS